MRAVIKNPGTTRTTIRLKPPLGGRLAALPCSPDKLRGFHPDWVFCDEASIVPSGMITSEIMMMLTKPDCHFVMSGTPKGFDHVLRHAFFDRERYSVHHYASFSSPLVSKERLGDWKLDMTEEEWTREVEAQWTELANVFFPMDLIMTCVDPELGDSNSGVRFFDDLESVKKGELAGSFFAGLDVGKQMDPSVLAVVQKVGDKRRLVYKHQFALKTPYPDVIGHVVRANQVFDFVSICVDKTGVGDVIVDELEQEGLSSVKGLVFTDRWKQEILTYLKLLMEQKLLGFLPDDSVLISQMNEQQFEYTQPKTAREHVYMKFWHPLRRHDDQLFALALACYASKKEEPYITVLPMS
jgi:phage FluMu gp28-like protein